MLREDAAPGATTKEAACCPVIGIGASAGGLEAFKEFFAALSPESGFAFVLVQHLDPNHESMLVQLLAKMTHMHVQQIEDSTQVCPNQVYLIPPNASLTIERGYLQLAPFAEPRGFRRPIDVFFRSLAEDQGANAACIILSGTGSDGVSGLRAVKEAGGLTLVQEPETARYDGMPTSAAATGLVDHVLPANEMPGCLIEYFGRVHGADIADDDDVDGDYLASITQALREHVGHDFRHYKQSTLARRIGRRMQVLGTLDVAMYIDRLKRDPTEIDRLFRDLLINVTGFFRDAGAFEVLRSNVIPSIIAGKKASDQIRVWVPGCSSGEEAYTLAMLLQDALPRHNGRPAVCIFATDIDERMLSLGRRGHYPESVVKDVPAHLREAYLMPDEGGYMVSQTLRDSVRFSSHSLIKDPPFSRLDLISCRNLLIYFGNTLQNRVLPLFHYALRSDGYLFLGPSENIAGRADLFRTVESAQRIYQRRSGPASLAQFPLEAQPRRSRSGMQFNMASVPEQRARAVGQRVLERYAPPHVLVDVRQRIVHASARTGKYLELSPGEPTARLDDLARAKLKGPLASLIEQVTEKGRAAVRPGVEFETESGRQRVDLVAEPMDDDTLLIIFRDSMEQPVDGDLEEPAFSLDQASGQSRELELEEELGRTRERLRTVVEELETSNEELRSSNEEMMSMNEELQSTNEELITVNEELKDKLDELARANSDLQNYLESTQLAVIFVDRALRIRAFTPVSKTVFHLKDQDFGRPLTDIAMRANTVRLEETVREVIRTLQPYEEEVRVFEGGERSFMMRILPYRTVDDVIDGAVLTFADITSLRYAQAAATSWQDRYERASAAARQLLYVYDRRDRSIAFTGAVSAITGYTADELEGPVERWLALVSEEDRADLEAALTSADDLNDPSVRRYRIRRKDGTIASCEDLGHAVEHHDRRAVRVIGLVADVTERQQLEDRQRQLMHELQHRVKNTLATVNALVRQTAKDADSIGDFEQTLTGRIEALASTHSLLSASNWAGVRLDDIVAQELAPYRADGDEGRHRIGGDTIILAPRQALTLTMALHELATNAVKYGALSVPEGLLQITWQALQNGAGREVVLEWCESGGPPVQGEVKPGFGFMLLRHGTGRELGGTADLDLRSQGVRCRITFPLMEVPDDP